MEKKLKTVSGGSSGGAHRGTSTSSCSHSSSGGGGGGGQGITPSFPTWEEMVPAWDPQALVGVETRTPPLDSAGPVVTVTALVNALTALQRRQQEQQEEGQNEDPFPDFLNEGLRSRSSSVSSLVSPNCGAAATAAAVTGAPAAAAAATVVTGATAFPPLGSVVSAEVEEGKGEGTLTPNMFARSSSCMSFLPLSPFDRMGSDEEKDEEGEEGVEEVAARQLPALASATNTLAATFTQEHGAHPFLAPSLPPYVFVTFLDDTTVPASLPASPRNLKLFIGPLASDPVLWADWGLPADAFPSFSAAVNDAPSSLDTHIAALLPSLPASALSFYNRGGGEGSGGGAVLLLTLPSPSLRPATSLEVLVASFATSSPSSCPLPSLLDLLRARILPPSFWREYFSLPSFNQQEEVLQEAGREGGTGGGLTVVYDFLLSYLLSPSSPPFSSSYSTINKHWVEEALNNGLRIVLHPVFPLGLPPALPSRGVSLQSLPPLVAEEYGREEGRKGGREGGRGSSNFVFDEADLEGLFEEGSLKEEFHSFPPSSLPFAHVGGKQLALMQLARHRGGGGGEEEMEEGEKGTGQSGRALRMRRLKYYDCEDDKGEEEEEEEGGVEEGLTKTSHSSTTTSTFPSFSSSSSSSPSSFFSCASSSTANTTLFPYHYPGRPAPVGKELPDRGRHKCRVPGCSDDYRWPDYKCKAHGGGRCQFMWWRREGVGEGGMEACPKFHQSKNSRGELLCGEHCRLTGAVYGEVSRRGGKAAKGAGGLKKGKRTAKKKVWG